MITALPVGQMATNCYIVDGIIIDPGDDAEFISSHVQKPTMIIATHGHFDHIMAAFALQLAFHIPFAMHEYDEFLLGNMQKSAKHFLGLRSVDPPPKIDTFLKDGDKIGNFTILHTPGHTPGSICLVGAGAAFTGDTIFADGAVGRTDFSYSEKHALDASVSRILSLSDATKLYSGHGEATTVQKEKKYHTIHTWN